MATAFSDQEQIVLSAKQLHLAGRHHTLLPATSLEASRAQVMLVQADGQERRTALALALTGRMKPSSGTVVLGHDHAMAALRKRSAIIDSPEVNAPENHLTVRSLVSEDLALVPFKFRDRTRPTAWLVKHGFRDILDKWVEELEPNRLLHLQLELALADHDVDLLVVDSPDRHTADASAWLPLLEQAAAGLIGHAHDAGLPPREVIVIGVVGRIPDDWTGPTAAAGQEMALVTEPAEQAEPAESPEPPAAEPAEPSETDQPAEQAEPAELAESPKPPAAEPDEPTLPPEPADAPEPPQAEPAEAPEADTTNTEGGDVQ
ncbi:ABC transporter ATP-binding protein [Arthrobacter sp. A2-55]|uniref:ABC transporter ATP-binding protein n=1 Tax=Arthrobacter sp. A2-55 TaxID=2897337 RepID=UPI0021CD559E|nr:ABC transporter ATP-binding protein [Arthrobacter sp. A2-55]MCU6479837.1 ABC transporter ATP-binding protein [Arthrobacter sp. A2-55]